MSSSTTTSDAWRVEVFKQRAFDDPDGVQALAALRELGADSVRDVRLGRGFLLPLVRLLLLSAAHMFFRDVNYLTQVGVILLMFATSVVYPLPETHGATRVILSLNPMSSFLDAYREILVLGQWPGSGLIVGAVGAVVFFALGGWLFRKLSPYFAEEV